MHTKCMQDGSFHSWINVWVAGKTKLCVPGAIQPRVTPLVTVKSSLSVGRCALAFDQSILTTGRIVMGRNFTEAIQCDVIQSGALQSAAAVPLLRRLLRNE